jgi:hypothetical protein
LPYNSEIESFGSLGPVDRIEEIVERAIVYTATVLRAAPEHFEAARAGLERLRSDLALEVPDHPALERLRSFLHELVLGAAERPWH